MEDPDGPAGSGTLQVFAINNSLDADLAEQSQYQMGFQRIAGMENNFHGMEPLTDFHFRRRAYAWLFATDFNSTTAGRVIDDPDVGCIAR